MRLLLGVAAALTVNSVILALTGTGVIRLFFSPDTSAAPLVVGCFIAALRFTATPMAFAVKLEPLAFGVVTAMILTATSAWRGLYTGGLLLFAASTGVLLLASLEPAGLFVNALRLRGVVWLGRVSYSLYLWHLPILFFLGPKIGIPGAIALSVGAAAASYYLVELPFLRRKRGDLVASTTRGTERIGYA